MLLNTPGKWRARRMAGAGRTAAVLFAGLMFISHASAASENAESVTSEENANTVVQKRVLVFTGVEDEIIFDDMVVGDRVRIMQFEDGNGEHRIIRVHGDGGDDDEIMKWVSDGDAGNWSDTGCIKADGEGDPVMLEFQEESGEPASQFVYHTVICLTGDDASAENRAVALEKAISEMEDRAKEEEARRRKMIKSLRKQARELKKQQ